MDLSNNTILLNKNLSKSKKFAINEVFFYMQKSNIYLKTSKNAKNKAILMHFLNKLK